MKIARIVAILQASRPLLPFSDSFSRADGDLVNGWEYTAGKWTTVSNAAVGVPGLGPELIANGAFDDASAWTLAAGWAISGGVAVATASISDLTHTPAGFPSADWYRLHADIVRTSGGLNIAINTSNVAPGDWLTSSQSFEFGGRGGNTSNPGLRFRGQNGSAFNGTVDNVALKKITLADMFCTRNFGASDIDVQVEITRVSNMDTGLVICLDNKTNPANYIIGCLNSSNRAILLKCVGGITFTYLILGTIAYVPGSILRITKTGNTVRLYYNGAQVGLDQTVSDVGIASNTRHGLFSTGSGSFDDFGAI